jgi:hypothetical protein
MKTLAVLALALSSLLRPCPTLCVEPTGDIHVEQGEMACCATADTNPRAGLTVDSDLRCTDCRDIPLLIQALSVKRVSNDAVLMPGACIRQVAQALALDIRGTGPVHSQALLSRTLSTTVLRR